MVFFSSGRCNLQAAHSALARTLRVSHTGVNELMLTALDTPGPTLRVCLAHGPNIRAEAAKIAAGTPHVAAMAACDARFEIVIDDLAAALDEMNTLMEAQLTLQDLTAGLLFNTWTGKLSAQA